MNAFDQDLGDIAREPDQNRRNLRVAQLVSRAFQSIGCEPVVVGGSAVEFYSDGGYVSGDVDICFTGSRLPTAREREQLMAQLGRSLGIRKTEVAGVLVDVMGWLETEARTPCQEIGELKLIQIEDLIAERLLVATVPSRNEERFAVARLLVGLITDGLVSADMEELRRVANSSAYRVGEELESLMRECREGSERV